MELRERAPSSLRHVGPAPQAFADQVVPDGAAEIEYTSGDLSLKAWFATPSGSRKQHPVIVYYHSAHALGVSDWELMQPFLDAGFAVLTPSLRGENGNPGNFELFGGELDDAINAIRYVANRADVDAERIYTFGHSVGGGLTSLLSLSPTDVPIRMGGSCSGIYAREDFAKWGEQCPFDPQDYQITRVRVLDGNLSHVHHRHIAYVGSHDPMITTANRIQRRQQADDAKIDVVEILGDHLSVLPIALKKYLSLIAEDANIDLEDQDPSVIWSCDSANAAADTTPPVAPKPDFWDVPIPSYSVKQPHLDVEFAFPIDPTEMVVLPYQHDDFVLNWKSNNGFRIVSLRDFTVVKHFDLGLRDRQTIAISPNGQRVAQMFKSTYPQSYVRVTDTRGKDQPITLASEGLHPGIFEFVDDHTFMTRDIQNGIRLFDLLTGVASTVQIGSKSICPTAVSPDRLILATVNDSGQLVVCDATTGKQIGCVSLPDEIAEAVRSGKNRGAWDGVFSPDGQEFATGISSGGKSWLLNWDLRTGKLTHLHEIKVPTVQGLARENVHYLDHNAGWLVGDGSVAIARSTGEVIWRSKRRSTGRRIRVLPGNRRLLETRAPNQVLFTERINVVPTR
ncbi:MAG: prolyl oligopeptidase family serine peptidase [Pirellulaceae bacterium]|nr:prolyl oligopeptidase family serine peptidase [Pirellulaceae bacterium]